MSERGLLIYGGRLEDTSDVDRSNICERLRNGEFDLVIYGKVGRKRGGVDPVTTLPYWNTVSEYMERSEIAFLYGGDMCRDLGVDSMDADIVHHLQYGTCFVREGMNRSVGNE